MRVRFDDQPLALSYAASASREASIRLARIEQGMMPSFYAAIVRNGLGS